MKSRDYLVSLGLVKKNSRGRISAQAKTALAKALADGMEFSDISNTGQKTTKVVATQIKERTKTRKQTIMYAIDKGQKPGQEDLVIGFSFCYGCKRTISFCTHQTPVLPPWIQSNVYWEKP